MIACVYFNRSEVVRARKLQ